MKKRLESEFKLAVGAAGILCGWLLWQPSESQQSKNSGREVPLAKIIAEDMAPRLGNVGVTQKTSAADRSDTSAAAPKARVPLTATLGEKFLDQSIDGKNVKFTLPNGKTAFGQTTFVRRDQDGILQLQGVLTQPEAGEFFFQRQTMEGKAGKLVGSVQFHENPVAWRIEPSGPEGAPEFVERERTAIVCAVPDQGARGTVMSAFDTHPTNMTQPSYQAVQPLTSLPGAEGVIYLDFDGGTGPFPGWGGGDPNFSVLPSGASNAQIFEIWQRVAEDYAPFNLCVTTDLAVYEKAAQGRRIRSMITPTNTAYPVGAGNAFLGSFNWTGDPTCWTYITSGKNCAEAVSHEVGHTLGLAHHGRTSPAQTYYQGSGTGAVSWAPIMGSGNNGNLSQWSHGEYANANNPGQDDLLIIATQNNGVAYRDDDYGDTLGTAGYLEVRADDTVSNEGIIEQRTDVDAFRFTTAGGAVSLSVSPASTGPNLDILAELCDANTGTVIASDNGLNAIDATVATTLAAGEYLLKVSGVGRGDPAAADGYSDYASLGTFTITGTVAGGGKPDRLTVAEETANNTVIGTVAPRLNHGSNVLTFSITSGNTGGAWSIDSSTGVVRVANSAALDYETLSSQWDDPATFELFVSIVDGDNPSLNESIRLLVSITNVNEVPTAAGTSVTMLEHTIIGTHLVQVVATDPDAFDFPTYTITAGNGAGLFAIDQLGKITVASNLDLTVDADYVLTVHINDQGTPALGLDVTVNIHAINTQDGFTPGQVTHTIYANIPGATVADLSNSPIFPDEPWREEQLTSFAADLVNLGNFGATLRGCICVPTTGDYQFWISGDDATELWLSPDSAPETGVLIASNALPTGVNDWDAQPSQASALITLQAGICYFMEARHKQNDNYDHVEVAWAGPGISREVIPGRFSSPCYHSYLPHPVTKSYTVRENAISGSLAGVVTATDVNLGQSISNFQIVSGNTGGAFEIHPTTGELRVAGPLNAATTPTYTLTISCTDNDTPPLTGSGTVTVNVQTAGQINLSGIVQQRWLNLPGALISTLTSSPNYPFQPDNTRAMTDAIIGTSGLDSFGSRIRFLVTAPTTGTYNFYIAADQVANLYVSTDATATNAGLAASLAQPSGFAVWTTFPSQRSTNMSLVAGQKYYVEVIHKEDTGGDHAAVGWTGPGIPTPTFITAANIQAYDLNTAPVPSNASYLIPVSPTAVNGSAVGTVVGNDPEGDSVAYAITSGNAAGAFAINPATGQISVANATLLTPYAVFALQVCVQDYGLGNIYPLKTATVPVTIYVNSANVAPTWTVNPVNRADAPAGTAYTATLAGSTTDPNFADTVTYSKVNGAAWLNVNDNGTLSGTPVAANVGLNTWTVRATDGGGLSADATLQITVTATAPPPPWSFGDIGSTGLSGTTQVAGAGFLQLGAGVGVNGKSDAGQFLRQTIVGDGEIRAQIASLTGGSGASTGIMLRDSTSAGARTVWLGIKNGNFTLSTRSSSNGTATNTNLGAVNAAPNNWVRLTRSEDTINAYLSANGTAWTAAGTLSVGFSTTILAGQFTASGNTNSLASGTTATVSITLYPSPWVTNQIGSASVLRSAEFYNNVFTLNCAGTIGGTGDVGTYVNQTLTGDGQISVRLTSVQNTSANARLGVVMRDTTSGGSREAFMGVSPDGTYRFQYRTSNNGNTTTVNGGTGTFPNCWVRLVRSGNTFSGYKSSNGTSWTLVGSQNVTMGASANFGIIGGSGSTATLGVDTFDNVTALP